MQTSSSQRIRKPKIPKFREDAQRSERRRDKRGRKERREFKLQLATAEV